MKNTSEAVFKDPSRPSMQPDAQVAPEPEVTRGSADVSTTRDSTDINDSSTTDDGSVGSDHSCFELTYDMMLGIRTTVSACEARPLGELTPAMIKHSEGVRFPCKGSKVTPAHNMSEFYFKDYGPEVFRRIRHRFGINAADYLLDICGNFEFLEFMSNSKSGEFFFFSHNREYMIKTISAAEGHLLFYNLDKYYDHVMKYKDTLITRFYGLHKVRLTTGRRSESYFLIMGSIFPSQQEIHTKFDLKGSRLGRSASEKDKENPDCVYKDNDYVDMNIRLKMRPCDKPRLVEQLKLDVALLRDLNIMDYSLLLGIHYKQGCPFLGLSTAPAPASERRRTSVRPVDMGLTDRFRTSLVLLVDDQESQLPAKTTEQDTSHLGYFHTHDGMVLPCTECTCLSVWGFR